MSNTPSKLRKRPARQESLTFALDPNDSTALNRLQKAANEARAAADRPKSTAKVKAEAREAEEALDAFLEGIDTVTFVLRSCGPRKAEKIMAKHPATAEQIEKHQRDMEATGQGAGVLQFDPDAFPPALIAACLHRVEYSDGEVIDGDDLSADDIADMLAEEGWSSSDGAALFTVCETLAFAGSMLSRDLVDRLGKG